MGVMKCRESKFGAPAGIYLGRFVGVKPFVGDGKPRLGRDGKPMGPAVEWQWEITAGEQKGQFVGRITAADPTTKNACGTLLSGLMGRPIRPDEEFDPDECIGQVYQVVISPSKEDPDKTQVTQVVLSQGSARPATPSARPAPASPAPRPAAKAPPPKPALGAQPSPTVADMNEMLMVQIGIEVKEMTRGAILDHLRANPEIDLRDLPVCKPGADAWSNGKDMGLDVPF